MNKEQIELASKVLVNFCQGEINNQEALKTIIIVLKIIERIENGIE